MEYNLEWLKANALFQCQITACAEEVSHHVETLRLWHGSPICEECYWQVESENDDTNWNDLPGFKPFEFIESKESNLQKMQIAPD